MYEKSSAMLYDAVSIGSYQRFEGLYFHLQG